MSLLLSFIAIFSVLNIASPSPVRTPKCLESSNPFNWVCSDTVNIGGEASMVLKRDISAKSDNRTLQFADTFSMNEPRLAPDSPDRFSPYPRGFALLYPGFVYSMEIHTEMLSTPSPPKILVTDPKVQAMTGQQPSIIRRTNTSSFDLRSVRFACAYTSDTGDLELPSCFVTFVCKPKMNGNKGTPKGHRPTPRAIVQDTFEFAPARDRSDPYGNIPVGTLPPIPRFRAAEYAEVDFSDLFYDLDSCYIMLQQYSEATNSSMTVPAVLLDDVVGVAYVDK